MDRELPPTEGHSIPPPMPTTAGAEFGNYRIISKLGQGGMGAVLLAAHTHLGVRRALKLIRPSLSHQPEAVARFQREMLAAGGLEHENVVRAYDAGQYYGVHYLAMEYADGPDARKVVRHQKKLRPADAAEIIRQAAVGLEEIRQQNLVHRDIKSSNMIITSQGVVKLLDLGLARSLAGIASSDLSSITIGGAVLGTADYMAPEQADNSADVDIRADIYSLGCAMFEMLTGLPPFNGPSYDSWTRKVIAHASQPVELPEDVREQLPPGIVQVLLKMLAKDRGDRFQTPQEIAGALQHECEGADLVQLVKEQPPWEIELDGDEVDSLSSELDTPSNQAAVTTRPLSGATPSEARSSQKFWATLHTRITILLAALLLIFAGVAAGVFLLNGADGDTVVTPPDRKVPDAGVAPPPVAVKTPATLRDYTGVESNLWHNTMVQDPVRVMWDDTTGLSNSKFDPRTQQLFVFSRSIGLLGMGKTTSKNFDFEVTIHQDNWQTGVGIFWGYHPDPHEGSGGASIERPATHNLFQYVQFVDEDAGIYGFKMQRGDYKKHYLPGDMNLLNGTTQGYQPIKLGVRRELTLKIQIREGQLSNVQVEDESLGKSVSLNQLCTAAINEDLEDFPSEGVFGCFCYGATANFTFARYQNK